MAAYIPHFRFCCIESWGDKGSQPPINTRSLFTEDERWGIITEQAAQDELFLVQKERGAIVGETVVAVSLDAATDVDAGSRDTEGEKAL